MPTTRSCTKLDHIKRGPFRIIPKFSSISYQLELSLELSVNPTLHISLLVPFKARNGIIPNVLKEDLMYDNEYFVQDIVNVRMNNNSYEYLVSWKNCPRRKYLGTSEYSFKLFIESSKFSQIESR